MACQALPGYAVPGIGMLHVAVHAVIHYKFSLSQHGQQEQLGKSAICCLVLIFVELDSQMSNARALMLVLTRNAMIPGADVHPTALHFFTPLCCHF